MRVGVIGLGVMGLPMTRRLLAAGHAVTVASRSPGPVQIAAAAGATAATGPAELGTAGCEVVILCVPDTPDVVEVVAALLPGLRTGTVVVDCSTIDPEVEREQHERVAAAGGRYLDAPVSGGPVGARAGTLTLMVGGDAGTLDVAQPALQPFSDRIVHVGGPGSGQVVKLANNQVYAAQMLAVSEAFTMLDRSGVDLPRAAEVLRASTGDCTAVRTRIPFEGVLPHSPASTGWRPGFATRLMAKDVRLAVAQAARCGVPVPSVELSEQFLTRAIEDGYADEDFSAVGKVVRAAAGSR